MNIVIPMAGRGTRVQLDYPKPLATVCGKPIVEWAVSSLGINGNYIFITRHYDNEEYNRLLNDTLKRLQPDCKIISVNFTTDGPVCSALLARQFINNDQPLIVTNCDQYTTWNAQNFLSFVDNNNARGAIVTYDSNLSNKSYVLADERWIVTKTVEKEVISNDAFTGIHYWRYGSDFVKSAEQMMMLNQRVNNEFYVAPSYNHMIANYKLYTEEYVYKYPIRNEQWWSLGTDSEIKEFLKAKENGTI